MLRQLDEPIWTFTDNIIAPKNNKGLPMGKPIYRRSNTDLNDSQLIATAKAIAMTSALANAIAIAQATDLAIALAMAVPCQQAWTQLCS